MHKQFSAHSQPSDPSRSVFASNPPAGPEFPAAGHQQAGRPDGPAQLYIFKLGFQGWGFHKGFGVSAAGPSTYLYITVNVYMPRTLS
jgi:hypothetical protein